jgi:hypothetical protein
LWHANFCPFNNFFLVSQLSVAMSSKLSVLVLLLFVVHFGACSDKIDFSPDNVGTTKGKCLELFDRVIGRNIV